jgi:DNA-binding transcriptional regulator YdaS (Cro superfamily)
MGPVSKKGAWMKWLEVLRDQVGLNGQRPVAEKLGVSNTVVSQVCNEKYPGDMGRIQALVESVYMSKSVLCPVLGEIAWHTCQMHQKNKHTGNPTKLRLYRACRSGCENSDLPVTQNIQLNPSATLNRSLKVYDADAVVARLKRQVESDGGGPAQLAELLQSELKNLATKLNRTDK